MSNSVSLWIVDLQKGDAEAIRQLWDRYFAQLVALARTRLRGSPCRAADEEDVVLSVFQSLCRGAEAGRFSGVKNRHELWWMLLAMTKQKVQKQQIRESAACRGAGEVRVETEVASDPDSGRPFELASIADDAPTPETLVQVEEQWQLLLSRLPDDTLRKIALWRIEGYDIIEIARKLGSCDRTVSRKLELIQTIWCQEFEM